MNKYEVINLIGNVLIGMACPFLFLLFDDPFKVLCEKKDEYKEK